MDKEIPSIRLWVERKHDELDYYINESTEVLIVP